MQCAWNVVLQKFCSAENSVVVRSSVVRDRPPGGVTAGKAGNNDQPHLDLTLIIIALIILIFYTIIYCDGMYMSEKMEVS